MSGAIFTAERRSYDSQRRGRYISKACDECRRRRTKCDGRQPTCSQCASRSLNCRYAAEENGRNPAPKAYVQLLRRRIELLEYVVRSHHMDIDAILTQCPPAGDLFSPSEAGFHEAPADTWNGMYFEGALCMDDSTNFDRDGEARYFGPASGRLDFDTFTLSTSSPDSIGGETWTPSSCQTKSKPPSSRMQINRLIEEIEQHNGVSQELEDYLLELYFTWEQPWSQVVDEQLFRQSRRSGGRFFSHLLLNSILSLGSRFSDRIEVRSDPNDPNTAGTLFLEKAEVLLHYDMKWPSITTIQALVIMANVNVASGSDAAGWLHLGMANRLAIDMGLNIDPQCLASTQQMSDKEIQLRRKLYLSLYVLDKHSASYTGRVCTILQPQGSLQFPSPPSATATCFSTDAGSPIAKFNDRGLDAIQRALVNHAKILEKILTTLYAPAPTDQRQQRPTFVENCLLDLRGWFYDLPADLRINRSINRPPHVFVLHMVYHTSFILLLKPFLCKLRKRHLLGHCADDGRAADQSAMNRRAISICREAATQILALAKRYRSTFGGFRRSPVTVTHCILSAALIMLQVPDLGGRIASLEDLGGIEDCLIVLGELSQSWNPAGRYYQIILRIWQSKKLQITGCVTSTQSLKPAPHIASTFPIQQYDNLLFNQSISNLPNCIIPCDILSWNEQYLNTPEGLSIDSQNSEGISAILPEQTHWTTIDICPLFGSLPEDYGYFENLNRSQLNELSL